MTDEEINAVATVSLETDFAAVFVTLVWFFSIILTLLKCDGRRDLLSRIFIWSFFASFFLCLVVVSTYPNLIADIPGNSEPIEPGVLSVFSPIFNLGGYLLVFPLGVELSSFLISLRLFIFKEVSTLTIVLFLSKVISYVGYYYLFFYRFS